MESLTKTENMIDVMMRNKLTVMLIIFVFLAVSIFLTGIQKREYSSQSQILVIQEQGDKFDAYIASKASESVAKNLKKAINSSSFRNRVLQASPELDFGLSNKSEKQRRKEWQKIIEVKVIPNTSILEITAYNSSPYQAEKLMNNINASLLQYHKEYHGGGDQIKLEVVDYPLTSSHPTRPDWILNVVLSLILSIFFAATLCSLFPNKVSKINNILSGNKDKKIDDNPQIKKVFESNIAQTQIKTENLPEKPVQENKEVEQTHKKINISDFLNDWKEEKYTDEMSEQAKNNLIDSDHYLKRKE